MLFSKPVNPMIVFLGVWIVDVSLLMADFSYLYDGLHEEFAKDIAVVLMSFVVGYILAMLFGGWGNFTNRTINIRWSKLLIYTKNMLIVWCVITIVEIIWSGGIPFIWYLLDNGKTYFDYGINGVHGFCNALYLVIVCNIYLLRRIFPSRKKNFILWALVLWPVLLITRQVFMVAVMNVFFLFIATTKICFKNIIKLMLICWFIVVGFGLIGDFRTGYEEFVRLAQPRYDWLVELPSGVIWGIMYFTSPIANLQNVFESAMVTGELSLTIGRLLPSPIRSIIFSNGESMSEAMGSLITDAFNVSSYMNDFYIDGGMFYLLLFTFIIGFMSRIIFYRLCRCCDYIGLLGYAMLCQMHFFSIFYNHYMYLAVMFSIVIVLYVGRRVRI